MLIGSEDIAIQNCACVCARVSMCVHTPRVVYVHMSTVPICA